MRECPYVGHLTEGVPQAAQTAAKEDPRDGLKPGESFIVTAMIKPVDWPVAKTLEHRPRWDSIGWEKASNLEKGLRRRGTLLVSCFPSDPL